MHHRVWSQEALHILIEERMGGYKFIVVSNREPFLHQYADGEIECQQPASGMATALHPLLMASGGTWIAHGSGDADRAVVDENDHVAVPPENPAYTLRRVWLTEQQEAGFYYGMANEGLWPLCHITFTRPIFRPQDWAMYREVNRVFAEAVLEEAGDAPCFVFIQDYHFCLLPRMLKEMGGRNLVIAHFWHIPWPNREIFRAFPWSEELLDGMLGSDLLGFHIRNHCQNFMETVNREIEGLVDRECWEVTRGGQLTTVRAYPISIDAEAHERRAQSAAVDEAMEKWRERLQLGDCLLGAGIERLDYTKGIPDRLRALDYLYETRPELLGQVTFVQIAVPSRSHLASYQAIEQEVDALVEQINTKWGGPGWQPVVLIKKHHNQTEMMALHRLCRFFVVNSLHDGMNLVAKEFVASRSDEDGVLILSRFTGAHRELTEALGVNPFAIDETADAMFRAITMAAAERQHRMHRLREQVFYNNVYRWAGKILSKILKFDFPESVADETALDLLPE
ncbi:MAG: alpha,alpha-trehalose-phosphate synthase (UDP-forming) [Chthoniobacteraceae bacterium]